MGFLIQHCLDGNPKAGKGNPKEAQNPKSELVTANIELKTEPGFWSWGEEIDDTAMLLRGDGTERVIGSVIRHSPAWQPFLVRISDFDLLSGFGFRPSDFDL
jgi:hypothetical protein